MNRIKHLLTITCLLIGTTFMYGQSDCDKHLAFFCEDFESYDATMPLGPQSDEWTTWSGTEGGAEDGEVSTAQANSGSQSMLITGGVGQDVILDIDDLVDGRYRLRFDIYIPEGNGAYYNIQHNFDAASMTYEWASQIIFTPGGFAQLDAGAGGDVVFEYPTDEWLRVDQIIDVDADTTSISVGGRYIRSWKFSHQAVPPAGSPPGEPGTNAVAAVNFYPIDANHVYYIDDLFIEELPTCSIDPSAIICDDMEMYTAGTTVGPQSSFWSTWSVADGSAEDAMVSTGFANSGSNSIFIGDDGVVDATVQLGNRTEGAYQIQFMLYIPSGSDGYFNLHSAEVPNPPSTSWLGEFYFGYNGTTDTEGMGAVNLDGTTFAHPHDQWFMVRADVDLDANTLNFWVDGVQVYTDFAIADVNLGCIDLFSASIAPSTMEMYFDDLLFKAVEPNCDQVMLGDVEVESDVVCFGENFNMDIGASVIPAYNDLGNLSGFIWGIFTGEITDITDPFNDPTFLGNIGGALPSETYPIVDLPNDGSPTTLPPGTYWFYPIYMGNAVNTNGTLPGFNFDEGCVKVGGGVEVVFAEELPAIEATGEATGSTGADGTASVTDVMGGTGDYTYLWSNGATEASIADLPPGDISCTITSTDANGCSTELVVELTVDMLEDVEDIAILESLTIAPNPSKGNVVVGLNLSESATVQLQIVSITGQVLTQFNAQTTNSYQQNVDLSHLANGLYFAKIIINDDVVVKKINLMK